VPEGPDLTRGVSLDDFSDRGTLLGHVGDEPVLLVRDAGEIFAIGAVCTHYKGPLAEGIVVGGTIRCPWHHACFNLATGEAERPPALDPVTRWKVVEEANRIVVREKLSAFSPARRDPGRGPASVVIIGAGAAGLSAATTLRQEGYDGPVILVSADSDPPYDRPNLSKDYLAGKASDDWMPLRDAAYYASQGIELVLNARVTAIDTRERWVQLDNGRREPYETLLLATGAEPIALEVPGAAQPHVRYLRSYADARAILQRAESGARAVIVGASFIALEVAAALRLRGVQVHVVAREPRPMERIFGRVAADFIRSLHESHGVVFHLEDGIAAIGERTVMLSSGTSLPADFVVVGIGVRPSIEPAASAGIATDQGILVGEYLETNVPGVFAAGDVARWLDPSSGERIRVEHWVVAQRQGQVAARNMLGRWERFDAVPFFWSQHYEVTINYVGHAEHWDAITQNGRLEDQDCTLTFLQNGRAVAVATIGRDRDSLSAEAAMEGFSRKAPLHFASVARDDHS
jgi:NADPH-dependent 2,4-dienoyl-CoA reductase/sulfur reductase-like enzyme/nitrite reductase/ring-hydroxylating ferredoxin subunit